jgi:hypothetical protein
MNSGRAKKIAKALYGDLSRRGAKYFKNPVTGQITREVIRDRYQDAKKNHNTVVKRRKQEYQSGIIKLQNSCCILGIYGV